MYGGRICIYYWSAYCTDVLRGLSGGLSTIGIIIRLIQKQRTQERELLVHGGNSGFYNFVLVTGQQSDKLWKARVFEKQVQNVGIDFAGIEQLG
ncbi:MAG: hypothetical protein IJW67_09910 [Blautia sp.]|nr:hypothetical protein [Blautia sp.]